MMKTTVFTLFDQRQHGSYNDSGVLSNSEIGKNLEENKFNIPEASYLANCNFKPLPYCLLRDDFFPLKSWLIRPFPGQIWTKCKMFAIVVNPEYIMLLETPLEYFLLGGACGQLQSVQMLEPHKSMF